MKRIVVILVVLFTLTFTLASLEKESWWGSYYKQGKGVCMSRINRSLMLNKNHERSSLRLLTDIQNSTFYFVKNSDNNDNNYVNYLLFEVKQAVKQTRRKNIFN